MRLLRYLLVLDLFVLGLGLPLAVSAEDPEAEPAPYLVVLGTAQDGGVPQAGTEDHPGWNDPQYQRRVVSLGLVDPATNQRWIFEATPDFPLQFRHLQEVAPSDNPRDLDGIFLTHAHIGHYTGLMHLGHEVMGANRVPVYTMPRMAEYLSTNGPWSQLVNYNNIELRPLAHAVGEGLAPSRDAVRLNDRLSVTPFLVPHRQEYSEVVGYRIDGPEKSALFIPDIDSWEELDEMGTRIEDLIASADVAYLDATFFDGNELPGRDMSGFPHPFIVHSMERFADLPADEKAKVRFIHFNHSNPALWEGKARRSISAAGHDIAAAGERVAL